MKKLGVAFVTLLIVAGFTVSAVADPGWGNERRWDGSGKRDQIHKRYDHRDYRDYGNYREHRDFRVHRAPYGHPVFVRRAPALPVPPVEVQVIPEYPHQPAVRVYGPPVPSFGLFLPHFSIQIN